MSWIWYSKIERWFDLSMGTTLLSEIDMRLGRLIFLDSDADNGSPVSDDDVTDPDDIIEEYEDEFVPVDVDHEGLRDIDLAKELFFSEWDVHMRAHGKHGSLKEDTTTPPFAREAIRVDVTWPGRPENVVILFYHRVKRKCAVVCYDKRKLSDPMKIRFRYPITKYGMADAIRRCVYIIEHGYAEIE
jgi:hypothetical protein